MLATTLLPTLTLLLSTAFAAPAPIPQTTDAIDTSVDAKSNTAPVGKGKFGLLGMPEFGTGALGFQGMWVTSFHTGAGTAVATMTFNQSSAALFNYNGKTQDVFFQSNNIPYSLGFSNSTPYMSNAPAGRYLVTLNAGFADADWEFSQYNNIATAAYPHEKVEVCYVNATAPYFSLGPQYQLFWRGEGAKDDASCLGLEFKAVFKNGFAN